MKYKETNKDQTNKIKEHENTIQTQTKIIDEYTIKYQNQTYRIKELENMIQNKTKKVEE